jgi:hypothetical protein
MALEKRRRNIFPEADFSENHLLSILTITFVNGKLLERAIGVASHP